MMLVPRRNFDLFDDFFDDDFFRVRDRSLMKTDIKETKNQYIIDIDLPGFNKDNISLSLNNGYLSVDAKVSKQENNEEEKYVRKERYYGECSRKFYVGDNILESDINAEYKNGILNIQIPKKDETDKSNEIKQIEIK